MIDDCAEELPIEKMGGKVAEKLSSIFHPLIRPILYPPIQDS
jgi:hypothetical protein